MNQLSQTRIDAWREGEIEREGDESDIEITHTHTYMSDEEYIVRREVSDEEEEPQQVGAADDAVFDNEFRMLVLANSNMATSAEAEDGAAATSVSVEESDMEELLIRQVRTLNDVNEFFDEFDSVVAVPNEGHLKYEVGSDGLCVVLVDSVGLKEKVVAFVRKYMQKHDDAEPESSAEDEDAAENDRAAKRRR